METNANVLVQFSNHLAALVAHAGRSVVRVEARRRGHASGIAWSADGLVITANHAVQRDDDLRIGLPDEQVVAAELVGRDPTTDVAVLRAPGAALQPPTWAEADTLQVGHLVLSVGRHDAHAQAGLGILSKRDGAWHTAAGGRIDTYLQTDIAVYPGFSGSALVDAQGRVCGMNTSWFLQRSSLALPVETLRRVVSTLLRHGRVRRGLLGIGAHPALLPEAAQAELGQRVGLLVLAVEPDSPAADAGVLVGDLLVSFDGQRTEHVDTLLALLTEERVGKSVPLRLVRGGQAREVTVTIGER